MGILMNKAALAERFLALASSARCDWPEHPCDLPIGVSRRRRPRLLPWVGGPELLVAQMPCVSVPPSVRRLALGFGFQFHLAGATVIEVLRQPGQKMD